MRKLAVLSMGLCIVFAFTSCKSSESAYKKAYEKAKQQEIAQPQVSEPIAETPVVAEPVMETPAPVVSTPAPAAREEKVTIVSGANSIKDFSVIAGSFGLKANAEGLKEYLDGQGYNAVVVYAPEKSMYRVIVNSYDTKAQADSARDTFKAKYPNREDFQGAWILLRLY